MPKSPFQLSEKQLFEYFAARSIPVDSAGFCDHPAFLAEERKNPNVLNYYASWISRQHYDSAYLQSAKSIIDHSSEVLLMALRRNGRLGACVDISGILFRILEEQGVWSCCIKGSVTATFPSDSGISPRYFWSVDTGSFTAGHAWLIAPPYKIIDLTISQQPYKAGEGRYVPDTVLALDASPGVVSLEDIISPEVRAILKSRGIANADQLRLHAEHIPEIHCCFPVLVVEGRNGSSLKYAPVAITAPAEKLEHMRNMNFDGKTPWEFYQSFIAGKVSSSMA